MEKTQEEIRQDNFFNSLDKLELKDRVHLKRAAGQMLSEADAGTQLIFYGLLPRNVQREAENRWFLAACLHCLEPVGCKGRKPVAVQAVRAEVNQKNLEKIMDTNWDETGYLASKLYRLVRLVSSRGCPADCSRLLTDLNEWNYPRKPTQRRWALEICGSVNI